MLQRKRYTFIKPNRELTSEEEILDDENYSVAGSYPAAEFDDLVEFFIFLKESGFTISGNDQMISEYLDNGVLTRAHYIHVSKENKKLFKTVLPENVDYGCQLIKKVTLC